MKRILLILSVMLIALPAIADGPTVPSDPTYYQPGVTVDDGCGEEILGNNPNSTEVNMVAQYTPICGAGQYSDTSNDPNGVCTNCSGTGKYCPGMTAEEVEANLDSVTGLPKGNLGIIDCPVGYTDAVADATATTISACKKIITSCQSEVDNFRNGTMTVNANITLPLPLNYRDVDSHCYGSLECDAGYIKQNVYEWALNNPEAMSSITGCSLGGFKDYTSTWSQQTGTVYSYTPCDADMEPGTIKLKFDKNDPRRPMDVVNYVTICSDESQNIITAEDAAYAGMVGTSAGANCYGRNVDVPDQPWVYMNHFEAAIENGVQMTAAERCQKYCGNWNVSDYPMVAKNGHRGNLIVKDSHNNYYAKDGNQFIPQTEIAYHTCYESFGNGTYKIHPEITTENDCVEVHHYTWRTSKVSIYFDTPDTEPVDDIGVYKYVARKDFEQSVGGLLLATEDDENVKVCGGRTVNIDWVGVEEPGDSATCTYKYDDMAVPTAEQTPQHEGYTFVGWTVGPVAAPSNNSNENNGSESENNGG